MLTGKSPGYIPINKLKQCFKTSVMIKELNSCILFFVFIVGTGCSVSNRQPLIQHVNGAQKVGSNEVWLTHEHILVDFVGADSIQPNSWNHETVIKEVFPFLEDLKEFKVNYFVDATPNYLGRDVLLLKEIAR